MRAIKIIWTGEKKGKGGEKERGHNFQPPPLIIGFGSKKGAVSDFHRPFFIFAPHTNWRIFVRYLPESAIFRFVPSLLSFLFFLRSAFVSFNYCLHSFPISFLSFFSFSAQLNFTHAANGIESPFRCFFPACCEGSFLSLSFPLLRVKSWEKGWREAKEQKGKGRGDVNTGVCRPRIHP